MIRPQFCEAAPICCRNRPDGQAPATIKGDPPAKWYSSVVVAALAVLVVSNVIIGVLDKADQLFTGARNT